MGGYNLEKRSRCITHTCTHTHATSRCRYVSHTHVRLQYRRAAHPSRYMYASHIHMRTYTCIYISAVTISTSCTSFCRRPDTCMHHTYTCEHTYAYTYGRLQYRRAAHPFAGAQIHACITHTHANIHMHIHIGGYNIDELRILLHVSSHAYTCKHTYAYIIGHKHGRLQCR